MPREVPRVETPRREPRRVDMPRVDVPRMEVPRVGVPRDTRRGLPPDMLREMLPDMIPVLRARGISTAVGCLKRLLVIAVILAILFAIATAWFFSGVVDIGAVLGANATGEHGARAVIALRNPGVLAT